MKKHPILTKWEYWPLIGFNIIIPLVYLVRGVGKELLLLCGGLFSLSVAIVLQGITLLIMERKKFSIDWYLYLVMASIYGPFIFSQYGLQHTGFLAAVLSIPFVFYHILKKEDQR